MRKSAMLAVVPSLSAFISNASAGFIFGYDQYAVLEVRASPDSIVEIEADVVPLAGYFGVLVEPIDVHLDEGDAVEPWRIDLANSEPIVLTIAGLVTATIPTGSLRFLDWQAETVPIGPGGQTTLNADLYVANTIFLSGLSPLSTTITSQGWLSETISFSLGLETSASMGDYVDGSLIGIYSYELDLSDISQTITLDFVIQVAGEHLWMPEPCLLGLVTMGVCGAGGWLCRRRIGRT